MPNPQESDRFSQVVVRFNDDPYALAEYLRGDLGPRESPRLARIASTVVLAGISLVAVGPRTAGLVNNNGTVSVAASMPLDGLGNKSNGSETILTAQTSAVLGEQLADLASSSYAPYLDAPAPAVPDEPPVPKVIPLRPFIDLHAATGPMQRLVTVTQAGSTSSLRKLVHLLGTSQHEAQLIAGHILNGTAQQFDRAAVKSADHTKTDVDISRPDLIIPTNISKEAPDSIENLDIVRLALIKDDPLMDVSPATEIETPSSHTIIRLKPISVQSGLLLPLLPRLIAHTGILEKPIQIATSIVKSAVDLLPEQLVPDGVASTLNEIVADKTSIAVNPTTQVPDVKPPAGLPSVAPNVVGALQVSDDVLFTYSAPTVKPALTVTAAPAVLHVPGLPESSHPIVEPKAEAPQQITLADGKSIMDALSKKYNKVSGRLAPNEIEIIGPQWGNEQLNPEAVKSFRELAKAFKEQFGKDIVINDSYRSYDGQVDVYKRTPNLAAVPGSSNHGWGLAIDLGSGIENYSTDTYKWMKTNAAKYGWVHPAWAEPGGSSKPEPWHWEFAGGNSLGVSPAAPSAAVAPPSASANGIFDLAGTPLDQFSVPSVEGKAITPIETNIPDATPSVPVTPPVTTPSIKVIDIANAPVDTFTTPTLPGHDVPLPDPNIVKPPSDTPKPADKPPETTQNTPPTAENPVAMPEAAKLFTSAVVQAMLPKAAAKDIATNFPLVVAALLELGIADQDMILYTIATDAVEAGSFMPIPEYGKGGGRYITATGNYYGRGFVQLTHDYNYAAAGAFLKIDLIHNPDLALEPKTAARVQAWYMKMHEKQIRDALAKKDMGAARVAVNGGHNALDGFIQSFQDGVRALAANKTINT